jgi:Uma2 family endonuclease
MPVIPGHILDWRKRTGADQRDEMWDGVLHMSPEPNCDHQDFEGDFETWLRIHWARPRGHRVLHRINVAAPGEWPINFRIPDLVLLTRERFSINKNEYFDGGPDVVVEIRSPDDETYDKLSFYAEIGVLEIWVIDRDTKEPELYLLPQ